MKSKVGHSFSLILLISQIFIFLNCDNYLSRRNMTDKIIKDFKENKEIFMFIKSYLSTNSDSIYFISCQFEDHQIGIKKRIDTNRIQVPDKIGTIAELMKSDYFKQKVDFYKIIKFMIDQDIRIIEGDSNNVYVGILKYSPPCYSIRFNKKYNVGNTSIKRKVHNFYTIVGFDWIYLLGDGWYIKGENCSSI